MIAGTTRAGPILSPRPRSPNVSGTTSTRGRSEPFTPQFIVDGGAEMRLSERQKIPQILSAAAAGRKIPISIESLAVAAGSPTT